MTSHGKLSRIKYNFQAKINAWQEGCWGKEGKSMERKFEQTAVVTYHHVSPKGVISQQALLAFLQDLAIGHADSLGYTLAYLAKMQRGWALTNWHIYVQRWPKCGEELRLATWSSSCRRLRAARSFEVMDQAGERIIWAESRWVFMDLSARKPCLIPEEMSRSYESGLAPVIEGERYRMAREDRTRTPDRTLIFQVRRSETDTNGHVNNTQYVAWAMDLVSDRIYDQWETKEIQVVYRKECYRHQTICARSYETITAQGAEVMTVFADETGETVLAEVVSRWA